MKVVAESVVHKSIIPIFHVLLSVDFLFRNAFYTLSCPYLLHIKDTTRFMQS